MTHSKVVIGLIVLMTSCTSAVRSEGTVSGLVTAGPICPVEIPGDPTCAPVPVVGSVEFLAGSDVVASAPIEADGQFAATLDVGDYTLHINVGESPFPSCPDQPLTVVESEQVTVNLSCDTGIRGPGS